MYNYYYFNVCKKFKLDNQLPMKAIVKKNLNILIQAYYAFF